MLKDCSDACNTTQSAIVNSVQPPQWDKECDISCLVEVKNKILKMITMLMWHLVTISSTPLIKNIHKKYSFNNNLEQSSNNSNRATWTDKKTNGFNSTNFTYIELKCVMAVADGHNTYFDQKS